MFYALSYALKFEQNVGCFVWGGKNGMGCFVGGGGGGTKTAWNVLSGGQIFAGCFVRAVKNSLGCFVPECFVLHSITTVRM